MSDDFDRLRARLDAPHAPAWRPEPGGDLVGTVAELGNRTHPDWGSYPIVIVATADGELAWHAYGKVARQQLDDAAPSVGGPHRRALRRQAGGHHRSLRRQGLPRVEGDRGARQAGHSGS